MSWRVSGFGVVSSLSPWNIELAPARKHSALDRVVHLLAPGRETHHRGRHGDAGDGDGADEFEGIEIGGLGERRAGDPHQHVDRHAFWMLGQGRQGLDKPDPLGAILAHADDAATTDLDAGVANMAQRIEAFLIGTGSDDVAVHLGRGVEIVVVIIEPGGAEALRLFVGEHPQGDAGLEPKGLDALHHLADPVEITVLRAAPRGAHAEPAGAGGLGACGVGDHRLDGHQFFRLDPGVILGALRAIGAVLGTAAGLDAEQGRDLYPIGIEVAPVNRLRLEQEIVERQGEQRGDLRPCPIVPHVAGDRAVCFAEFVIDRRVHAQIHPSGSTMRRAGDGKRSIASEARGRKPSGKGRLH